MQYRKARRRWMTAIASAAVAALASTSAAAQTTLEREALERQVASGRPVNVLFDGQAEPIVGILNAMGKDTIDLLTDGRVRQVPFGAIGRITRDGDSVWSGTAIGAAALSSWCAYICGQGLNSRGQALLAVLNAAAWGGAVGALADWSNTGTTTLYKKRPQTGVSTAISPGGVVISARFSWR
jgi:hypothetical protein